MATYSGPDGRVEPPPGLEVYNADLEEFRRFMAEGLPAADSASGAAAATPAEEQRPVVEPPAESAVPPTAAAAAGTSVAAAAAAAAAASTAAAPKAGPRAADLLRDDRSMSRGPPRGSGLLKEETATVEIVQWKDPAASAEDGAGVGGAASSSAVVARSDGTNLIDKEAKFEDLGLNDQLLQGVYDMGFVKPSKIQAAALPLICNCGQNMIGQAQNGSGKTATFALALLSSIRIEDESAQALVLCPTRELARQVETVIAQLGQYMKVITVLLVPQGEWLPANPRCHVLIGTPGKVADLTKKHKVDVSHVKVFVLDEADQMLDQENRMGKEVTQIRKMLPRDLQVLFFSATYPDEVRTFAETLVPRALSIKVKKEQLTVSSVTQMYMRCADDMDKFDKLCGLYGAMNVGQSVVFVNQRTKAFGLAKRMRDAGFTVSLICGTQKNEGANEVMDPALRDQVMDQFRSGVTRVLIATDVLSRGIDVPQVTLVVNYELPNAFQRSINMETYLHRVGRTGRFGLRGIAVNLVTGGERNQVQEICSFFECTIEEMDPDFEKLEEQLKMLR